MNYELRNGRKYVGTRRVTSLRGIIDNENNTNKINNNY